MRTNGKWVHSTIYKVPANSIVHVTSTSSTATSGLRNPFLSQVQGTVGGTDDGRRQDDQRDRPRRSLAHVRDPPARRVRAAAGRARRSQEPVRIRALRTATMAHRTIDIQLPHRQEGPLPLAVLRALRRRHASSASAARCRRSATWTGSSMSSSARLRGQPSLGRTEPRRRFATIWIVASLIAMPLVIVLLGPILPPGHGSEQALGAGHRQHGAAGDGDAGAAARGDLPALRGDRLPPADRAARSKVPRCAAHPSLQTTWIVVTSALVLCARRLRHRAPGGRATAPGSGSGPNPLTVPKGHKAAACR